MTRWTADQAAAVYRPLSGDLPHAEYAARLTACQGCKDRAGGDCLASGARVATAARKAATRCPLSRWPGDVPPAALLETDRVASEVTVGIVTFRRPAACERLVQSVRARYPRVRIVVADNGDRPPDLSGVTVLRLPFDCGVSASRNAIADALETPYLFLADDDAVFTDGTDLGKLLDVLDADPRIGEVGAGLWERRQPGRPARLALWPQRLEIGDGFVTGHAIERVVHTAPGGTPFLYADTCHNHAMFRREMLAEHRWTERLKIIEHLDFHARVKLAGKWRTAVCETVHSLHERVPTPGYDEFRGRREEFKAVEQSIWGEVTQLRIDDPRLLVPVGVPQGALLAPQPCNPDRPNVVVLGVGHCGTTVVTRMLGALGWQLADADDPYAESVSVRDLNDDAAQSGRLDADAAARLLASLPQPWAVKDPRFCERLQEWLPLLRPYKPLLLWLDRDREAVLRSHERRGRSREHAERFVDARHAAAQRHFDGWPFGKLRVSLESLADAVRLFDADRPGNARRSC